MLKSQHKIKTVYVGMSGGVDSSVAGALLKKQGFNVVGVFMKPWQPESVSSSEYQVSGIQNRKNKILNTKYIIPNTFCLWQKDREDAMRAATAIGIPLLTWDFSKEYKKLVTDYMIREYKAGRTPNPDVMCNKEVKFGAFYKWAMRKGADYVATGHYARIESDSIREARNPKHEIRNPPVPKRHVRAGKSKIQNLKLKTGKDKNKDQSYFLWNLKQEQLGHILFPVGHLEKTEVRKIAEKHDLITAGKKDSQGLCFIGKVDMKDFLKEFIKEKKGNVLDISGKVIGSHDGAVFYTIGERHGFEIFKKTPSEKPHYIISKNFKKNTITVSQNPKKEISASVKTINLKNINWISDQPKNGERVEVRLRYRQTLLEAKILKVRPSDADIILMKPETTVTAGQSLVMYQGEELVGGGVITEAFRF